MRSITSALLVLALLLVVGCGGAEPEGNGGSSSGGTKPTTSPFGPSAGTTSPFGPPTPTTSPFAPPSTTTPTTPPATQPPVVPSVPAGNRAPVVSGMSVAPTGETVAKRAVVTVTCAATDPDGDALTYKWSATGGSFGDIDEAHAVWRSPDITGSFKVTVTVADGRGGSTTAEQSFTVVDNAAPTIASLTASPEAVAANGYVTITAAASDPDGDALSYRWSADGGVVTGIGASVTWQAPDAKPGEKTDYAITLNLEDGRGGQDVETVHVTITIGYGTKQYSPVAADTGTVIKDGGVDMSVIRTGDTVNNDAMRAFVSFDLGELHSTDVTEATVTFTHLETVGKPFKLPTGLRGVKVYVVRYDPGGLPDFDIEPLEQLTKEPVYESPTTFDVTKFVQRIGQNMAASDQLQFMLTFQLGTNNDNTADYMAWSKASLSVTFAPD